ncbi:MAG TPA: hydrogenase subunit MbhD domain-containing protein [Gaiellaceae bacterium]|nr:hydrogenase subunit MbhD domain-containing protein [Gaiellaceae bacterium]
MIVATLVPLQATILGLVAIGATCVALCRNTLRQIVLSGVYGLTLVILFVVLQAPDVALSMLVVSTVAYPLIVLVAIARSRHGDVEDEGEGE